MEVWLSKQPKSSVSQQTAQDGVKHVEVSASLMDLPLDIFFPNMSDIDAANDVDTSPESVEAHVFAKMKYATGQNGLTCRRCGLTFSAVSDQQSHFSSDFHCFNLKRALKNKQPVTFDEFEDMAKKKQAVNDGAGSQSESDGENSDPDITQNEVDAEEEDARDSDTSSDESDGDDGLGDADYRHVFEDQSGCIQKAFQSNIVGPQFKVQSKSMQPWHLTLSVGLFPLVHPLSSRHWNQTADMWSTLWKHLRLLQTRPLMCVFILRSGKFAAAVFDNSRPNATKALLIHKVIRRYTVRAKAGGGQSSHDNKAGKANSMGAQLRRYGEQKLREDVENLLSLWQEYLSASSLIAVAATKRMRPVLFESVTNAASGSAPSPLLKKSDPRVVTVPFLVDTPTLQSAQRIRERLLHVTISSQPLPSAEQLALASEVAKLSTADKSNGTAKHSLEHQRHQQQQNEEKQRQLAMDEAHSELLLRSPLSRELFDLLDGPAAGHSDDQCHSSVQKWLGFFSFNGANVTVDDDGSDDDANVRVEDAALRTSEDGWKLSSVLGLPNNLDDLSSALHVSSARGLPRTTMLLLLNGANPEQQDARGRPAYLCASTKEVRDVFRRARATLGEECWNWGKAAVPDPLTDEKLALQRQKEREKKKRAQQRKKDEKLKAEQQQEQLRLQQLQQKEQQRADQERAKERAGTCPSCGVSLYQKDFYDVLDQKCCSTECVAKLRRKLAADAAMARFKK